MSFLRTKTGVVIVLLIGIAVIMSLQSLVFGGTFVNLTLNVNSDLENGLVGHWSFDGSLETQITDESGSGSTGYFSTTSQATSSMIVPGALGQAVQFDGVDDFINIGHPAPLQITGSFSIAAWVKADSFPDPDNAIVSKFGNSAGQYSYFAFVTEDNGPKQFAVAVSGDGTAIAAQYSSSTVALHRWYHVVGVYDTTGPTIELYVDGERNTDNQSLLGTIPASIYETTNDISIGKRLSTSFPSQWDGVLDDVRIYDRALSANEVKRLYGLGATTHVNTTIDTNPDLNSGLVGHWSFDGADILTQVTDQSGNGNTGYFSAASEATSTIVVPGKIGQGVQLDGSSDYISIPAATSLNLVNDTDWSASVWVYWRNDDNRIAYNMMQQEGSAGRTILGIDSQDTDCTNDNEFYTYVGGGYTCSGVSAKLGVWQHVVMTVVENGASDAIQFYVDGVAAGSGTKSSETNDDQVWLIGTDKSHTLTFDGILDDVRIYNKALSADEVRRLYELGGTTHVNTSVETNPDLNSGLVGHWSFDGADILTQVTDQSGNGNTGYLDTGGEATSTKIVPGEIGQALDFDGTDDSVTISPYTNLDTFSVSLWIDPEATTDDAILVTNAGSSNPWPGWSLMMDRPLGNCAVGDICMWMYSGATGGDWVDFAYDFPAHTWTHFVATYSTATGYLTFYANGSQIFQELTSVAPDTSTADGAYIGRGIPGWTPSDQWLNGKMDDVRIYNRALTAGEVKRLYDLGR